MLQNNILRVSFLDLHQKMKLFFAFKGTFSKKNTKKSIKSRIFANGNDEYFIKGIKKLRKALIGVKFPNITIIYNKTW